jgi:hypothetical protein
MLFCIALFLLGLSGPAWSALEPFSLPDNIVVDLRIFEARSGNPNYSAFEDLGFFINTDGRRVTENQWLATVAGKVPGSFVAALAAKTARVEAGFARFEWTNRSRSFHVDIDMSGYSSSDRFDSELAVAWMRQDETILRFTKLVTLQVGRTAALSARELEIKLADYLSTFRGYRDREHRGLLFEKLQTKAIHLILVATPRLLAEDERAQLSPENLSPPAGSSLPELDNPLGVPLNGTIVVGFEIASSGAPVNPQIVWSTIPEANSRILGEVADWHFPSPEGAPQARRWGEVEIEVEIP